MAKALPSTQTLSLSSPHSEVLLDALVPFTSPKYYKPGNKLIFQKTQVPVCHLIMKGIVSYYRQDDDVLLGTVHAPAILGIAIGPDKSLPGYIKTVNECIIRTIPTQQAYDIIDKENLWKSLANHLRLVTSKLYISGQQLMAPSAYESVCIQLYELMGEDETLRSKIPAELYIREKTSLSRSRIMHLLSDLKTGGYIEIERGRLIAIKSLPKKY